MRLFIALIIVLASWTQAFAAASSYIDVQGAIKFLPHEQAKNIVRIEAREGGPAPDCWYIQTYDSTAEDGLREFVVTSKGITASRNLSQFLTGAKADDVVGSKLVKVESGDLIKLVQKYAEANKLDVAKINYTMLRDASNPAPIWQLNCFDADGKKLALLIVNARNATVVSHDGFDLEPGQTAKASPSPSPKTSPAAGDGSDSQPDVPVRAATAVKPDASASASPSATVRAAVAVKPATPVLTGTAAASASPKKKGGLFERMFHGKDKPTPTAAPVASASPER